MYKLYRQKIKGGIAVDEIKVGEYVRTKDGVIAKVTDVLEEYCIDCNDDVFDLNIGPMMEIPWEYIEEYIVNHSFNIIELIENKDILKVKTKESEILIIGFDENTIDIKYKEIIEEIENGEYELLEILTHEQYKRNCYRLENN